MRPSTVATPIGGPVPENTKHWRGVLASTAVGLVVDLVTGWTRRPLSHAYLVYDGNKSIVKESITLLHLGGTRCPHFPDDDVGDPLAIEL